MRSSCCAEQTDSDCFTNGYSTSLTENKIVNWCIKCWMDWSWKWTNFNVHEVIYPELNSHFREREYRSWMWINISVMCMWIKSLNFPSFPQPYSDQKLRISCSITLVSDKGDSFWSKTNVSGGNRPTEGKLRQVENYPLTSTTTKFSDYYKTFGLPQGNNKMRFSNRKKIGLNCGLFRRPQWYGGKERTETKTTSCSQWNDEINACATTVSFELHFSFLLSSLD